LVLALAACASNHPIRPCRRPLPVEGNKNQDRSDCAFFANFNEGSAKAKFAKKAALNLNQHAYFCAFQCRIT
jgi:hypothetical protein